ncbi:Ribosomal protein L11 methyltransferase (PrmA) [Marinobacter gudaonensis]|uniref:Ribosomal protein L11 methyltransferase (PrmA) n=1 Tax=Marinobacter gudaonensis TaxID=375760 RepID=A0A1I6GYN0_9GAMM|nr:50S ribosomal protein L11 methyltransferase [Marinobacter gudaonensis]SFR47364.1 Ribosomal protein L11 methyltransferase (PrmA) [Marinobacter gudaonensis]
MWTQRLNHHLRQTLARGRVAVSHPAGCPRIALYLFDPGVLEGPLSHEEAQAVVAEPAYWSFCWASGQVLAQWILDNPHWVAGKRVLDFGSGSGVVAVASALAGARQAIACDTDPAALDAARANAELNGVEIGLCDDWDNRPAGLDVVTAADVLYDPENRPLLGVFRESAGRVLLADSRMKVLGDDGYRKQTTIEARTWPDLHEFEEFNRVRIYLAGE